MTASSRNRFVCVANIASSDPAAVVAGNEKVLAARLSDAQFFWEQDLKVPLAEQAKKLDQIVFHEKLGTVADKAERVAKLAEWLVQRAARHGRRHGRRADRRAARQGRSGHRDGRRVPRAAGRDRRLLRPRPGAERRGRDAIRDHYKPAGQSDDVPTDPVTVAVNIADRLDTLVAFFSIGEKPTGSRDPFALRRAALGFLQILITVNGLRLPLSRRAGPGGGAATSSRGSARSRSVTFPDLLDGDEDEHEITAEVGGLHLSPRRSCRRPLEGGADPQYRARRDHRGGDRPRRGDCSISSATG